MIMHKHAVIIEDADKDGRADLSLYREDERLFTIYNLKKLGMEAAATCGAVFCALVGHGLIM